MFMNTLFFLICLKMCLVCESFVHSCHNHFACTTCRGSRLQTFFKIGVLKNFVNFAEKHLCWSLFLNKLQAWKPTTLLKTASNTDVSLWHLQYFNNTFFHRTFFPVADFGFELNNRAKVFLIPGLKTFLNN